MKLIITEIEYKAGILYITLEEHPIGNEFTFKEIHDLIEEYGAVNEVVFKDNSDLNKTYDIASMIRTYKSNILLNLITDNSTLDCLDISNILRPIPFENLLMNGKPYGVKNDKLYAKRI